MRAWQNSDSSAVPKSGISRYLPLPRRHRHLIENARLTSKLNGNPSSQLQISNRERMAISSQRLSLFSSFEPQAPSLQILIETPRLRFPVTPTNTPLYKVLIETKTALFSPLLLAWVCVYLPLVTHHSSPLSLSSPLASSML